ncbi:MAG: hypothetical protein JWM77_2904 [Rhodospirillales bacterium]|nr:hypothetical protein [Rhodospirillales bacterium]
MVHVSHEGPEQTDARLRRVIASARLTVYDEPYTFYEFSFRDFALMVRDDALAIVRDDSHWSQLVPSLNPEDEQFTLFRFHFPDGADNSGFVGWLATHLKRRFGTGVFVICGHNSAHGGIYDYWGAPRAVGDEVLAEVRALVAGTI